MQKNWKLDRNAFATIIDADTGHIVADFGSPHLDENASVENAQIGVAAPRLLNALIALREEVVSYGLHHPEAQAQFMPDETLEMVDGAIAEAKGATHEPSEAA